MSDPKPAPFPVTLPRAPSPVLRVGMFLLFLAGAGVFVLAARNDPARAWRGYLVSVMFFMGLSLAGVVWSAATRISNGRFARPLIRIMEALGSFVPLGALLMVVFLLFGARHVYPWIHEVYKPVPWWLTLQNMMLRDVATLAFVTVLFVFFIRAALIPDMAALKEKVPAGLQGLYRGIAGGFSGSDIEVERHRKGMMRMSPAIIIVYAMAWTLLVFDLMMSFDTDWASSMFGGILFMGSFLGAIAATGVIAPILRRSYQLDSVITPVTFHDIGKLMFGLSVFWAYVNFSQFLPIWYAKLPEETHWYALRLSQPWAPWSFAVPVMVWAIPFFMMMTLAAKRNPGTLTFFALVILAGLWLERFVIIEATPSPMAVPMGVGEIATMLGFLGLFVSAFLWYIGRFPVLPVVDPYGAGGGTH